MPKRKPIKPRAGKTMVKHAISHEVWVQPKGLGRWQLTVDDIPMGKITNKTDAVLLAKYIQRLLASFGEPTEFYEATRDGRITNRDTLPKSADPRQSEG